MATNSRPTTAMLSVRVDADALREFDSFAVGRGGRSALVRQMIERTLQEGTERPHIDRPEGAARNRISLRFTDVRSEKRRVGEEWFSTCSSRLSRFHQKKKNHLHKQWNIIDYQ